MSIAKVFLLVIGVIYLALAVWCALKPHTTAAAVGFELKRGSGESEYTTVYGGFQLALGLLFLWPLLRPDSLGFSLATCFLIHACLVVFRTVSFVVYSDIPALTYGFAALEWVIALGSGVLIWLNRSPMP